MATILIIDDDVMLLASLANQLEQEGYTVLKASELIHGELLFAEQHPDLVVLEVKAGRDAGWELLERLVEQTQVMILSAYSREEDVVRGLQAGAVDYIPKPYRSAELLARLRRCLGQGHHVKTETMMAVHQSLLNGEETMEQQAVNAPAEPFPPDTAAPYQPPPPPTDGIRRSTQKEESVFMTDTEEMVLLRTGDETPPALSSIPEDLSLGQRLNAERMRRRITLVQAESELHIRMWYLQAMEEEKFTLLPRGPLAGQMLRSYATYLGMDADAIDEEYQRSHYTAPVEPPPSLGSNRVRRATLPRWVVWTVAIAMAMAVSISAIMFFDPTGATALGDNLRGLIIASSPTPTSTPAPTATLTATPTLTPTPEPTATPTPVPPPAPPAQGEPVPPGAEPTVPPAEGEPVPPGAEPAVPPAEGEPAAPPVEGEPVP